MFTFIIKKIEKFWKPCFQFFPYKNVDYIGLDDQGLKMVLKYG